MDLQVQCSVPIDRETTFPPEIHHIIELFGAGNRSVTASFSCFNTLLTATALQISPFFFFLSLALCLSQAAFYFSATAH